MTGNRLAYALDVTDPQMPVADHAALLGGKGAGLLAMANAGLPVPPGFTLTTAACQTFLADGWSDEFDRAVEAEVAGLERRSGKALGSPQAPLLVSVRSGAPVSMPGMMDTVLNVGMTPGVEESLAALTGDPAFAADTHRRALLSYADIVLRAGPEVLANLETAASPAEVVARLRARGLEVPADPLDQIKRAVRVVFESWLAPRAVRYREIEGIDGSLGTAATVQAMVFGNLGDRSGTGVAFTRDPTTGQRGLIGDFLVKAQGEDVVAGTRLTETIAELGRRWPEIHDDLERIAGRLEHHYRDMVDLEFTVEAGQLWMLQARPGKRTPIAAFRVAIDMAEDPAFPVDRSEAVERCRRYFDDPPTVATEALATDAVVGSVKGLAASPGQGSGQLVLDPDRAVELADQGHDVVLARRETSPADVHGMAVAKGLFTTLGGLVSHAALVAREWGIPAVVGAAEAEVVDDGVMTPTGLIATGTVVTVDGDNGQLLIGRTVVPTEVAPEVEVVRRWARAQSAEAERDGPPVGGEPQATSPETNPETNSGTNTVSLPDVEVAFRVLHALRIKGMASTDTIAAMVGAADDVVRPHLDSLVDQGAATFMEPRQMWLLSAGGRDAHQPALDQAREGLNLASVPYQRFLELNDEFKQLCTDWQLRDGEPNDHGDADYDAQIVSRLGALDAEAAPILDAIGAAVPWTAGYRARLARAVQRLVGGDPKAMTGVMCDSYHDIWMELHEDLILTLGIDRAAEGST